MNTTADLLLLLIFLSALYTALGLLCGVAEKARELSARHHQRRRVRRVPLRRTPRRSTKILSPAARTTPVSHRMAAQATIARTRRRTSIVPLPVCTNARN
jgi:hypothetical protein